MLSYAFRLMFAVNAFCTGVFGFTLLAPLSLVLLLRLYIGFYTDAVRVSGFTMSSNTFCHDPSAIEWFQFFARCAAALHSVLQRLWIFAGPALRFYCFDIVVSCWLQL